MRKRKGMKIKCLGCGRRIKPKNTRKRCAECQRQHKLQRQREYYQRNKEKWGEYNDKAKEYRRQYYQRHKQRLQQYYQIYDQNNRQFRHTHDRTTDLTIENGRVKGTVWLESLRGKRNIKNIGLSYGKGLCNCNSLQKPFFIAVKNHRTYCAECGGKIIKAFENDYYTITEVCCCFCGLVLPQTTV